MRVAVILEQNINVGGGFQQPLSVIKLLKQNYVEGTECVFFVFSRENQLFLREIGVDAFLIKRNIFILLHRCVSKIAQRLFGFFFSFRGYIDKILLDHKIDLVYFLGPSSYATGLRKHNYIITVWDQCHRDWPEFPEIYLNDEFEFREFLYKNTLRKAVAILVDDELSKKKMQERYGVDADRIHVARFFPMVDAQLMTIPSVDVSVKYSVKKPFLFYPAQFWAHKNHAYILRALKKLKEKNIFVDVVFVGNDYGNKKFLIKTVESMNLTAQVHFLGFISREEVVAFYKTALALVMPTYFGPTNIPPLEAFAFGCPVCYSDLPGLREQVGDAAFLMNLDDESSLVSIIETLLQDKNTVEAKITAGYRRLAVYSETEYFNILARIFLNYKKIQKTRMQ